MELSVIVNEFGGRQVAEVTAGTVATARDITDLVGNASFGGAEYVLLEREQLADEFYDLSSGLAGELMQKLANYRLKLLVIGELSGVSDSFRAFALEGDRSGTALFPRDREAAAERLKSA